MSDSCRKKAVSACHQPKVSRIHQNWRSAWWQLGVFVLLFCLNLEVSLAAQESSAFTAADTSSPKATLQSFLDACNEFHELIGDSSYFDRSEPKHLAVAERVLDCIDTSELPAFARIERASEVAVCLKEILDRVELPNWDEIPGMEEIKEAGGFEELTNYRIPGTRITIARVEQGARKHEYLFSTGTVDRAVEYFKSIEPREYRVDGPPVSPGLQRWYLTAPGNPVVASVVKRLPERLRLGRIWGMANWKWLGIFLTTVVSVVLIILAFRLHMRFTDKARDTSLWLYWLTIAFPVAAMMIPLFAKHVAYRYLTLRSWPLYISDFVTVFVAILLALSVIFALSNRIAATVIASPHINPAGLNAQLIRIVSKFLSLVASVVLFLVGGQYLGIPIATLLTSAGIGGVAVALGAQDTLKTVFGTINLLTDRPFRVGDRIICEGYDGVVEDIGLRSTKMRMLNGHQVTLPNDRLAGNDIENVGRREFIRRVSEICIPLDTDCEKLAKAVSIIREEVADHVGMDPDRPPRVFFDEFTENAFTIKLFYWYTPPNYWEFKEYGDKLNFAIFRRFEAAGIQFSLPSRHSFWKRNAEQGPLDVNLVDDREVE